MQAMVLKRLRTPLEWTELPERQPGPGEIMVKVSACGVCRTDLHVVDGELPNPHIPIIPGHEIVGRIDAIGAGVEDLHIGERVGIPWLGHTCGACPYCMMHRENLCDHPIFTGFTRDGRGIERRKTSSGCARCRLWSAAGVAPHSGTTHDDRRGREPHPASLLRRRIECTGEPRSGPNRKSRDRSLRSASDTSRGRALPGYKQSNT